MPITDARQVRRFTDLCGASIPRSLLMQLEYHEKTGEGISELGVAYAALQSAELLTKGVAGLHFYTLNRSLATRAVVSALRASGQLPSTST